MQRAEIVNALRFAFLGPSINPKFDFWVCSMSVISWGWKISFAISSILGLIGTFLSWKLHETRTFLNLKKPAHEVEHQHVIESRKKHWKSILLVIFLSIFEVSGFYLIYYYFFENEKILKMDSTCRVLIYLLYLFALTIMMPIFGGLKIKYKIESLFKLSAIGVSIISIPLYFAIENELSLIYLLSLLTIAILLFCIQFSFLPSYIASLFPDKVRFTCIAFSFNITDGAFGGIISFFAIWLTKFFNAEGAFIIIFPLSALIFLVSLKLIKKYRRSYGN